MGISIVYILRLLDLRMLTCSHMLLAGQTGKVEGMLLAKPGNIKAKDEDERTVRMAAGVRVCRCEVPPV